MKCLLHSRHCSRYCPQQIKRKLYSAPVLKVLESSGRVRHTDGCRLVSAFIEANTECQGRPGVGTSLELGFGDSVRNGWQKGDREGILQSMEVAGEGGSLWSSCCWWAFHHHKGGHWEQEARVAGGWAEIEEAGCSVASSTFWLHQAYLRACFQVR